MPISMPSANRAVALAALAAASMALAQDNARGRIEDEGKVAQDRLRTAVAAAKDAPSGQVDPALPPPPSDVLIRRAFEGLHGRSRNEEMERRAHRARNMGDAALSQEREAQAKALRQALGLEPGEETALAASKPPPVATSWVPVLFVSSSMPLPVLRSYAAQLERVNGVLAFRGMPGGLRKVGPMAKLSAQMLRLDPGCEGPACTMRNVQLIVDPILFRQHDVTRVPALAMVPGDPTLPYCEREDDSPRAAHIVFGDSALSGLLEEYARLGGAREVKHAQALLAPR